MDCHIATSGWFYREWKARFYPDGLSSRDWFRYYSQQFDTVELNAPFYRWPTLQTIKQWKRRAPEHFRYSIKVNRAITHHKRFQNTAKLVREFYQIADVLGPQMGCFLFQLPPDFSFSPVRLKVILEQLDSSYRNALEFRHASWWKPEVISALRERDIIFCSVSAPRMPDDLVVTTKEIYLRLHGPRRMFYESYSDEELRMWVARISAGAAREVWVYFNNTADGSAVPNAISFKEQVSSAQLPVEGK